MRPPISPLLVGLLLLGASGQPAVDDERVAFPAKMPHGLPELPEWNTDENRRRFALGQRLFFDKRLSIDRTISCASCHPVDRGFASPEPLPLGVQGKRAKRHAPSLYNRAFGRSHGWDGKNATIEAQAVQAINDPNEMGMTMPAVVDRLHADATYRRDFRTAFEDGITADNTATAVATFVRGLVYGDTPVDRFQSGTRDALTVAERAGHWIYESKGQCWKCHVRPHFTDEAFHNTGVGAKDGKPRPGRAAVTGDDADLGRFKTPTLRGLTETAPYMHDGSLKTLEDVVAFYRRGGNANANRDAKLQPLDLTDEEAANLVAFLEALSRRR